MSRNSYDEPEGVGAAFVAQVKYWFRERELLLRSDGQVRFVRLTPPVLVSLFSVFVAFGVWGLTATAAAIFQDHVIDSKSNEINEAKLAFSVLREDLANYEAQISELTERIAVSDAEANRRGGESDASIDAGKLDKDVRKLGTLSERLKDSLKKLTTDVDLSEFERDRIIQSRDMLSKRVVSLTNELDSVIDRRDRLQERLIDLRVDLQDEEAARRRAVDETAALNGRVAELEAMLGKAQQAGRRLEKEVAALSENLESARRDQQTVVGQREGLRERLAVAHSELKEARDLAEQYEDKMTMVVRQFGRVDAARDHVVEGRLPVDVIDDEVATILGELGTARARVFAVEESLNSVLAGLVTVTGDPDTPERRQIDPAVRARNLLAELEGIHAGQASLLQSLGERTDGSLREAEELLQMTGLDVESFLSQLGVPSGLGGPLEPAEDGPENGLATVVYALNAQIGRWEAVRQALRCVPLISPVDFYHVASGFGKRRDPFTKKMAHHRGLDLAGWPGSPVWAGAPGIVTRAGRWGRYGLMVEIDHGCGIKTRYGHLKKVLVKKGEKIGHRHKIGLLGSTGRSTGPHVHYEVRYNKTALDPSNFIKAGYHVFKG